MKTLLTMLLLCISLTVKADLTGAGDAAIVQQLVAILKATNEQVKQFQEMTDIAKKLEDMETVKTVKKITEEGEELKSLIDEMETSISLISDIKNNPGGIRELETTIEMLQRDIDSADSKQGLDKAKAYARLISDLKRLSFIRKATNASMKKLGEGTNVEDTQRINATNSSIMTDILVQREQREKVRAAHDNKAVTELLNGTRYSSMVKDKEAQP